MSERVLASAGGLVLFAAAAYGLLWAMFIGVVAAQTPDPGVADGDPCCGHPDTWLEVATGIGAAALLTAVLGAALVLAARLVVWGARGRWLRRRLFAIVPTVGVALVTAAFTIALAVPP